MKREEAIKIIKSATVYTTEEMEALETLIPELRESKDERIRKRLLWFLDNYTGRWDYPETKAACRAWLEKQKELFKSGRGVYYYDGEKTTYCAVVTEDNPNDFAMSQQEEKQKESQSIRDFIDNFPCNDEQKDASKAIEAVDRIDKYIDKNVANAHDMKDSNPDKKYYLGWDDALGKMAGILQDVYSGEKQKEQKPAEWNDTDMKEARDNLISVCRDWERGKQTVLLPIVAVRARYFLEHIAEPMSAEWSEEDEKTLYFVNQFLEYHEASDPTAKSCKEWLNNRLKSLRPSWKPSEEQMKALKYVAYHMLPDEEYRDVLFSLFKDLKKLM